MIHTNKIKMKYLSRTRRVFYFIKENDTEIRNITLLRIK